MFLNDVANINNRRQKCNIAVGRRDVARPTSERLEVPRFRYHIREEDED